MPYLNEVRVIGAMAHEPELTMLHNGVPYCYFAIRMVQRTPEGEIAEDYLRIISYGDMAVKLVREFHLGDLMFCSGRLSPKQWENAAGREQYEMHVIAERIEKLAMGDGFLPAVTIDEAANAKASAFRMKEDAFIHSDTYRFRGVRDPNPPKLFSPQPVEDGSWHIPEEYMKQESLQWISREKERARAKKDGFGYSPYAHTITDRMEAERIAAMLVSWNLPRSEDGQWVRIPHGKNLHVSQYFEMLKKQDELLKAQTPEMLTAIMEMAHDRGVVFPQDVKREAEHQQQKPVADEPSPQPPQQPKPVVGSSDPKAYFKD